MAANTAEITPEMQAEFLELKDHCKVSNMFSKFSRYVSNEVPLLGFPAQMNYQFLQ